MTFDEQVSLSEAMRYPITSKGNASMTPCVFLNLENDCTKMDMREFRRNVKDLLHETYEVYDKIYSSRMGIE